MKEMRLSMQVLEEVSLSDLTFDSLMLSFPLPKVMAHAMTTDVKQA
jgi:hypothetical protein